jgi:carbonic anhydrase
MSGMPNTDPVTAWKSLKEGNERFVCGDSRVAAELIFDQGLGDMFVVRTAGHVMDSAVLGSLEFAVGALGVSVIVILGHDSCGAVKATLAALDDGALPGGYVRDLVERVAPSILLGRREGLTRTDEFEARHVVETGTQLLERSSAIAHAVAAGDLAVVGATYRLKDGRVVLRNVIGDVGDKVDA